MRLCVLLRVTRKSWESERVLARVAQVSLAVTLENCPITYPLFGVVTNYIDIEQTHWQILPWLGATRFLYHTSKSGLIGGSLKEENQGWSNT